MARTQRVGGEARVIDDLLAADDARNRGEELVVGGRDHEVAVRGGVGAERRTQRVAVPDPLRFGARIEVLRQRGRQHREQRVEHRHVEVTAGAAALPREERRRDPPRGEHPRAHVADGFAHQRRRALRITGDAHQSAQRLDDDVVGRRRGVRPGLPEARDAAVDQARIRLGQFAISDTELVGHARPEVLDHDVGALSELPRNATSFRVPEVEANALLVAVQHREARALAVDHDAHVALVVAARGLDLHHSRAEVAEHRGAVRPGQHAREIEDQQPFQQGLRWRPVHCRPGSHSASAGTKRISRIRITSMTQNPRTPL